VSAESFEGAREEHLFAPFVRILGKGKSGSRSLNFEEARRAFGMILRDEVEPVQLGAFLMLLRVQEESPEELAGFVSACLESIQAPKTASPPDLDWSSYAGKKSQQCWYVLSALLLASKGVRVLMHGADGHTPERIYTEQVLQSLGIQAANDLTQAAAQVDATGFAYIPLRNFCPRLHEIMQFRYLFGLRSPINTLTRLLNPLAATHSIQSVFHPAYIRLHQQADRLLGRENTLVYKGEGGEVEIKPHAQTRLALLRGQAISEIDWPRTVEGKVAAVPNLDVHAPAKLWRGESDDDYGRLAVCHTAATALLLMRREISPQAALTMAQQWWEQRDRELF
jgi:anthranilate phosphoribosyltransferase